MGVVPDEGQWGETERAVHRILETAVPSLQAPADRMDRVRRQVRRRRRRRAAAAAAASVLTAAVALVQVVWGPGVHWDEPVMPAAVGPASALLFGGDRSVRVELPEGWHAESMEDARGTSLAFVSSQPLSRPAAGGCVVAGRRMLRTCNPVARLEEGGVLVVLWPKPRRTMGENAPFTTTEVDPVDLCGDVGADGEATGYGHVRSTSGADVGVSFSVCRRGAAEPAAVAVRDLLESARVGS